MSRRLLIPLLLTALPLLVFAQAARFPFIDFDDGQYVYENPRVLGGFTAENVRWAFSTTHGGKWMPLVWLSFMLDAEFAGGPAPAALPEEAPFATSFHVTNVLLHTANGLLLFFALWALTGSWWRSGVVALLFSIHPLRVESVVWVTERKDVLSAFFGFGALWAYARYARAPGIARGSLVAVCLALSLMAKETFVTLPFVFLLLDFWPLRRARWGAQIAEKLPLFALVAASAAAGFLAHRAGDAVAGLDAIPLSARLANAACSYVFYLWKTVWPFGLAAFYPHRGAELGGAEIAGAVALLGAISALAVCLVRHAPWFAVGWCWFLGTLVPMLGIVQVGLQGRADRFTYFPQIGLFIAAVWSAAAVAEDRAGRRAAATLAAALAIGLLAWRAFDQAQYWQSGERLFAHAAEVTGCNAWAHVKLAAYYRRQQRPGLEIEHLRRALECESENYAAHMSLGIAYAQRGPEWRSDALHHLQAAVRHRPPSFRPYFNLGLLLADDDGALPAAEEALREAIARRSADDPAWSANGAIVWAVLGDVLARQGRPDEAEQCFCEARELSPQLDVQKVRDKLRNRVTPRR